MPPNTDYQQLLADADARFNELPLLAEGESKILRAVTPKLAIVRLKPTLYSITANRSGVVEGTDSLRLRISERLWRLLEDAGISTSILAVGPNSYLTEYVQATPIEVIVKACHVGTPKHIYHGITDHPTRFGGHICFSAPHDPYVRFDWRNALPHRDECMPLWLANQFIDVEKAQSTALEAFQALVAFLQPRGLHLLDICFMLTSDGKTLFSEVSPDCMRVKKLDTDMDKDLWRKGKDPEIILTLWGEFLSMVTT